MKNSKVSSHEIVDVLSVKASISKRAAEDFIKVLFTLIEDELLAGESVKIKNLGTFKLQWNEPRKSVNVQTGQEIILSGYNKVVFNPDEKLKELVNQPFAHLEAVVIGAEAMSHLSTSDVNEEEEDEDVTIFDPLKVFSDQATEIKDLLSEIQSLNTQTEVVTEVEVPIEMPVEELMQEVAVESELEGADTEVVNSELEPVSDPILDTEMATTIEEVAPEELPSEPQLELNEVQMVDEVIAQPVKEVEESTPIDPQVVADPTPAAADTTDVPPVSPNPVVPLPKRKSNKLIVVLIILVGIVVLMVGMYFAVGPVHEMVDNHLFGKSEAVVDTPLAVKEVAAPVEEEADSAELDTAQVKAVEEVDSLQLLFDGERKYDAFIATERIKPGTRLAKIALHHYGCRDFWVYIYEANKSKFPDPDDIPVGASVKVPKVDARLIDASNPRCIKKAKELHDLYKKQR